MAKSTDKEKEQKQLEIELLRNEFCVTIHKSINDFKSQLTDRKLTDKDVIHVLSAIISNKTE